VLANSLTPGLIVSCSLLYSCRRTLYLLVSLVFYLLSFYMDLFVVSVAEVDLVPWTVTFVFSFVLGIEVCFSYFYCKLFRLIICLILSH